MGAGTAFALLASAFLLNQLVGRGWIAKLSPRPLEWPKGLPRPGTRATLARFPGRIPEAFGFTLVERLPGTRLTLRRREVILLSDALLARLTPEERRAVVAHELGHVAALDGRYLTFLRTLSRLVRWDPVYAVLSRSMTRLEEIRADDIAVQLTGRPRALARALYKAAAPPTGSFSSPVARGLLGRGGAPGPTGVEERIGRLLVHAEECPGLD